jgi:MFS family permease
LLFTGLLTGVIAAVVRAARRPAAHLQRRREGWALCLALAPVLAHSMIEPFFFNRSVFWVAVVLAWMAALPSSPALPPDEWPSSEGASDVTATAGGAGRSAPGGGRLPA